MRKTQFLLIKLAEEAQEVAQRALKAAQFGLDEVQRDQKETNAERMFGELDDLQAALVMLSTDAGIHYKATPDAVVRKIEKVRKYMAYSVSLGMVEGEGEKAAELTPRDPENLDPFGPNNPPLCPEIGAAE